MVTLSLFVRKVKRMKKVKSKAIKVDYLARVEGEGALYVKIKDNSVADVKLKIFEPPSPSTRSKWITLPVLKAKAPCMSRSKIIA